MQNGTLGLEIMTHQTGKCCHNGNMPRLWNHGDMAMITLLSQGNIQIKRVFSFNDLILFRHKQIMLDLVRFNKVIRHHLLIGNLLVKGMFG